MSLETSALYERRGFQRALSLAPVAASAMAGASASSLADINLIEACRQIVALRDQRNFICAGHETPEGDPRIGPLLGEFTEKTERLLGQIEGLDNPRTLAGVRALAAAAMSIAPQMGGEPIARDDFEWLMLRVVEFFTKGAGSVS
jgi:hypothetical protein